jgi:hypothetical protein
MKAGERYWIGQNVGFLAPSVDTTLTWTDGSVTDPSFAPAYAGAESEAEHQCVAMAADGTWTVVECGEGVAQESSGFVCKRKAGGKWD